MLPKAILFDMDETLLTTTMPIESAWQEACELQQKGLFLLIRKNCGSR